jgi:hypothetical protein
MGKRGYDPKEKQSSTMSNELALDILLSEKHGFVVARYSVVPEISTAFRKAVKAARARFGDNAMISRTGRSITLTGVNRVTGDYVQDLRLGLSDMLGIGEKDALYKLTGIPEFAPKQK